MTARTRIKAGLPAIATVAAVTAAAALTGAMLTMPAHSADTSYAVLARGKRLVDAGDCIACHTVAGGKAFAGGRPIETPFGVIYSPNITPDRDTGIGAWSDDDFYRAMHEGISADGSRLYPAFPYPYFTRMTRDDVMAVRAYLNTLPAVHSQRPGNELTWPLNNRVMMRGWNMMFFKPGTFEPNPDKSAEWNRGAYLVEGPGHCGACHTPKNLLGSDKSGAKLRGGLVQNWFAPKIANTKGDGIGNWSVDDVVDYLKTGRNKYSGAAGLMAEVVRYSTSKLPEEDLRAIATYLKDTDGGPAPDAAKPDDAVANAGATVFKDSCSGCHKPDGTGVPGMFPPLAHNANVQQRDPTTVLRVILEGARTEPTKERPTPFAMPAYGWKLTDAQIAAVASYVRSSWGNKGAPVDAATVRKLRKSISSNLHGNPTGGS